MANEVLIPVKYVVDGSDLDKAAQKLGVVTSEEKKLEAEMNDVAAAARKQTTAFHQAGDAGVRAAKDTEKQYNMLGNSIGSVGGMIAGAFAIDRVLSFGKQIIDITAEFGRLKAVLATSLGSDSAAQRAFERIQDFAQKTNFSVLEVTESFVRLAGRGITLSNAQLTTMADVANATGKSLAQLTEAVLDVNNTERWTELGIKVKTEGDKIIGTYKGMTIEAERSEAGALKMVQAFGEMNGVMGTTAKISEELAGLTSNMDDAFEKFYATLGEKGSPAIKFAIKDLTGFITVMDKLASGGYTDYGKALNETFEQVGAGIDSLKSADEVATKIMSLKINASALRDEMADVRTEIAGVEKEILNSVNPYKEFSASTARLSDKKIELKGNLEKLKGEYDAYIKAIGVATDKQKEFEKQTGKGTPEELGRIEQIRLKMKEITEQRDTQVGLSKKQADAYNIQLAILQEELDTLTKFKREKVELSKLDADEAGLTRVNSDKKLKILTDEAAAEKAIREQTTRELLEELDRREEFTRQSIQASIDFAYFAAGSYAQFQSNQTEERIRNLEDASAREQQLAGDNADAKKAIEAEYNKRIQAERAKQAKLEQNMALLEIALDTAIGVQKAIAASPLTFGMPFSAFVAAQGLIQAALVKSQPIPRYAKGTRSVTGGTPGEDSVLAMLMPGERVVTTEKNRTLSPAFDVLTDSKRSPQFWNKTLMEIEKLGVFTPPRLLNMGNGGAGGGIDTDRIVAAVKGIVIEKTYFDERGVVRYTEREGNRIRKLNRHYGF